MIYPLVSIIILNWNGERFLENCLSSVLNQSYPNIEVIVVDNHSTDKSVEILETKFRHLKSIKSDKNLGFAAGNNLGIQESKGEYVILLNNDTEVEPDWVEQLMKVCQAASDIGMCASKVKYVQDREILNSTGVVLYRDLTAINRGIGEKDERQYDRLTSVFCPYGAAALYKRKMLDQIGFLDEDYFMFREEDELGWRANLAGWRCVFVPTAVVYHYRSAGTKVGSAFKLYYGERNRLYTCFKYLSLSGLITTFPATLRRYLFSSRVSSDEDNIRISRMKLTGTLLKAYFDACRGFIRMRKKGREFLKTLKVPEQSVYQLLQTFSAQLGSLKGQFRGPDKGPDTQTYQY